MDILRFITAGNVDDGKSTLIGRLLYDTKNLKSDVLASVSGGAGRDAEDAVNLAHITDGLRSEREQGITIDVAYKYFTTPDRKYIVTDAPGHFQYTKNLVTGASGVDAIIILIDARNGITEQTRRHSLVASFLKIRQVVVAVNKMDDLSPGLSPKPARMNRSDGDRGGVVSSASCAPSLAGTPKPARMNRSDGHMGGAVTEREGDGVAAYSEQVFTAIRDEYSDIAGKLGLDNVTYIPISALCGDNVSFASERMAWYKGPTLEQYLERCTPAVPNDRLMRFTVQHVAKNGNEELVYGKLISGKLKCGDMVTLLPQNGEAMVLKMWKGYKEIAVAQAGENLCMSLGGDRQAVRGNVISYYNAAPKVGRSIEVTLCWLDSDRHLRVGADYFLRINALETECRIAEVLYKTDVNSFEEIYGDRKVSVNEFARVRIETRDDIVYDAFDVLPENGRGIIIDGETGYTAGAFTIYLKP